MPERAFIPRAELEAAENSPDTEQQIEQRILGELEADKAKVASFKYFIGEVTSSKIKNETELRALLKPQFSSNGFLLDSKGNFVQEMVKILSDKTTSIRLVSTLRSMKTLESMTKNRRICCWSYIDWETTNLFPMKFE